jgi:hypothetical protein
LLKIFEDQIAEVNRKITPAGRRRFGKKGGKGRFATPGVKN